MAKAAWKGTVIAASDDVSVVDGYSYFPAEAVDRRYLQHSDHRSLCPWKGTARYYDVVVDGEVNRAAAWYYPNPSRRAAPLVGGRIGFRRGVKTERDDAPEPEEIVGAGDVAARLVAETGRPAPPHRPRTTAWRRTGRTGPRRASTPNE